MSLKGRKGPKIGELHEIIAHPCWLNSEFGGNCPSLKLLAHPKLSIFRGLGLPVVILSYPSQDKHPCMKPNAHVLIRTQVMGNKPEVLKKKESCVANQLPGLPEFR